MAGIHSVEGRKHLQPTTAVEQIANDLLDLSILLPSPSYTSSTPPVHKWETKAFPHSRLFWFPFITLNLPHGTVEKVV